MQAKGEKPYHKENPKDYHEEHEEAPRKYKNSKKTRNRSQWQQVGQALGAFSGLSLGLVILALVVYILMLRRKAQKSN